MKKEYLKYLWELAVQDFLGCATTEQLEAFKKEHPKFDMESTFGKSYYHPEAQIELLVKFMKDNRLGYFKEEHE